MTPEDFKAAMQADKEAANAATRAKWQGMVDEVFGKKPVQIVARLDVDMEQVRQQIDEVADRVMRRASICVEPTAQDDDAAFWAKVPEGYDWVAMDADGWSHGYIYEPVDRPLVSEWIGGGGMDDDCIHVIALDNYHPRNDWQNSLRRRPEGL